MTLQTAAKAFVDELDAAGIPYETFPHDRTTTALAEADALGVGPAEIAKTVVLSTPTAGVRAVLPASKRLDLDKVRSTLELHSVHLLDEAALAEAYPEFELGAVPPIGGAHHDRVLVDVRVCEHEFVLIEAGTHEGSVRVASRDLVAHEAAMIADIAQD